MEVKQDIIEGFRLLRTKGEIDLASSPRLKEALKHSPETQDSILLLDMSEVSFIDSSGLAVLIEYAREAYQHGGKIILFGLNDRVRLVFELVRLDEWFTILPNESEALDQAKKLVHTPH